jgi:hypothetical protein
MRNPSRAIDSMGGRSRPVRKSDFHASKSYFLLVVNLAFLAVSVGAQYQATAVLGLESNEGTERVDVDEGDIKEQQNDLDEYKADSNIDYSKDMNIQNSDFADTKTHDNPSNMNNKTAAGNTKWGLKGRYSLMRSFQSQSSHQKNTSHSVNLDYAGSHLDYAYQKGSNTKDEKLKTAAGFNADNDDNTIRRTKDMESGKFTKYSKNGHRNKIYAEGKTGTNIKGDDYSNIAMDGSSRSKTAEQIGQERAVPTLPVKHAPQQGELWKVFIEIKYIKFRFEEEFFVDVKMEAKKELIQVIKWWERFK